MELLGKVMDVILKAALTVLFAELIAGMVHWFEDAYIREDTPGIGSLLGRPNVIHHHYPRHMTRNSWWQSSYDLVILSAGMVVSCWAAGVLTWEVWLFALLSANANEMHKWTHRTRQENGRLITWLQDIGVLQTQKHHLVHHKDPKDVHYCTMTNLVNPVADGIHLWAGLEWVLQRAVGLKRRPDTSLRGAGDAPAWLREVMPRPAGVQASGCGGCGKGSCGRSLVEAPMVALQVTASPAVTVAGYAAAVVPALCGTGPAGGGSRVLPRMMLVGVGAMLLVHGTILVESASAQTVREGDGPAAVEALPAADFSAHRASTTQDALQTKRVMGIMPNFRSVSAGETPPPPTLRENFAMTTSDNFDYSALIFSGMIAAESMASKSTPEFHQGMAGYGRYYWHTLADQAVENYFVEFAIPALDHEDPRYYTMGRRGGGFFRRAGYSLSRVVVTRSNAGRPMFNYGEVVGSSAAAGVSLAYYPSPERTLDKGLRNWGLDMGYDSFTFLFREFWPDIHRGLSVRKR